MHFSFLHIFCSNLIASLEDYLAKNAVMLEYRVRRHIALLKSEIYFTWIVFYIIVKRNSLKSHKTIDKIVGPICRILFDLFLLFVCLISADSCCWSLIERVVEFRRNSNSAIFNTKKTTHILYFSIETRWTPKINDRIRHDGKCVVIAASLCHARTTPTTWKEVNFFFINMLCFWVSVDCFCLSIGK